MTSEKNPPDSKIHGAYMGPTWGGGGGGGPGPRWAPVGPMFLAILAIPLRQCCLLTSPKNDVTIKEGLCSTYI